MSFSFCFNWVEGVTPRGPGPSRGAVAPLEGPKGRGRGGEEEEWRRSGGRAPEGKG